MGFNGIIKVSDMTAQYKTVMRLTTVLRVRVTVKMKSVLTKRKNVDKNRGNATIELHSTKDTVLPQEGHHQSFQQMPQIDMFTSEWQPSSHTCQKLQKFFLLFSSPSLGFLPGSQFSLISLDLWRIFTLFPPVSYHNLFLAVFGV